MHSARDEQPRRNVRRSRAVGLVAGLFVAVLPACAGLLSIDDIVYDDHSDAATGEAASGEASSLPSPPDAGPDVIANDSGSICAANHTVCQDFSGPLIPPWSVDATSGSAAIENGAAKLSVQTAAADGPVIRATLPPTKHITCGMTVTVQQVGAGREEYIFLLNGQADSTWIGFYLQASSGAPALRLHQHPGAVPPNSVFEKLLTTLQVGVSARLELEISTDSAAPKLRYSIDGTSSQLTPQMLPETTFNQASFTLRPKDSMTPPDDTWSVVFDDLVCDE